MQKHLVNNDPGQLGEMEQAIGLVVAEVSPFPLFGLWAQDELTFSS